MTSNLNAKHSNISDNSQNILLLKRRGIDPFDGIDDDKGSKWHTFKDQLATAIESGGKREKLLVYGNQSTVTAANVNEEAGIMFADILSRDKSEYDKLWKKDYCWEVDYVQASVDEEKKKLFSFFALIFEGRCLTTIKQLGWAKVDTIFKKFEAEFGNVTKQDLHDLELKFEKGIVKEDGNDMYLQDDMSDILLRLEKSQQELALEVPEAERFANDYLTEEKLVEVICNSVHPHYAETISQLRFQTWMKDISLLTQEQQKAEHAKGFSAYSEYDLKLQDLKQALIAKYRQSKKLWSADRISQKHGKTARILSYGGPAVPINACWDCGSIEHRRGDTACPKPGSLSCAPQWLLDKQAEKNRVGGGSVNAPPGRKKRPTCKFWKRDGHCKFGKNCKFPHPEREKGAGKNELKGKQRLSMKEQANRQSRVDKFANKISAALVTAVKGIKRTDSSHGDVSDDESNKNPAKVMRTLVMKAVKDSSILMMRADVTAAYKPKFETADISNYGSACVDYAMLVNRAAAHSKGVAAFDNCAKISASNEISHFL